MLILLQVDVDWVGSGCCLDYKGMLIVLQWMFNGLQVDVDWLAIRCWLTCKWMLMSLQVDVDWIASEW